MATNQELLTFAYQKIGVIDETASPSYEQLATGLTVLNDYLLNQAADGMRLGWWKQTNVAATSPLRDEDVHGVKMILARQLAIHYGITIQNPDLIREIEKAETQLTKRSLQYMESDFSELSRPQGGPWGGPNWI